MIYATRLGTKDLPRAKAFYDEIAAMVDAKRVRELDNLVGYQGPEGGTLIVGIPFEGEHDVGNGNMAGFRAPSRAAVDAVHARAVALGGSDAGAPGLRGDDPNGFYGAYFRDLDGNKLVVFRYGPPDA
jgi:catechol 2,3-dioxygenase-like lactoylglutathione lyase family enzyme